MLELRQKILKNIEDSGDVLQCRNSNNRSNIL